MMTYLLDTNHASILLEKGSNLEHCMAVAAEDQFALCRPTVGELWFMIYNSRRLATNEQKLERLLGIVPIYEFDESASREFGRLRAELRRIGRPLPQIDVQIAAIARVNGLTVLTADAHFSHVPNLQVENWLQP